MPDVVSFHFCGGYLLREEIVTLYITFKENGEV